MFQRLINQLKEADRKIVFTEGHDARILEAAARLNEEKFLPGYDIVVVARSRTVEAGFGELTKAYLALAKKTGILAPAQEVKP